MSNQINEQLRYNISMLKENSLKSCHSAEGSLCLNEMFQETYTERLSSDITPY